MIRRSAAGIALILVLFAGGCSSGGGAVETQEQFGVRMAKMNLWREAMFRFRRAVEMSPDDAMAHNNLAVALEANGDFEAAGKSYREAMRLDKSNQYIQKNYSRFVEFTTRDRRRQQRKTPAPAGVTPAEDTAKTPDETPASVKPPASEPGKPPTPAEASDPDHGDPVPTSAAPAVTPAPNPAPPPVPPTPEPQPPPGGSL